MFDCLKTRGFRMEDTHVTDPDKIEKAVFVLASALGILNGRYPGSEKIQRTAFVVLSD